MSTEHSAPEQAEADLATMEIDGPDDDDCPNCGGLGFVFSCFEEYACMDPEEGCDECMSRCDWCAPPRAALKQD